MIFKSHILFASNCALFASNLSDFSLGNTLGQKMSFLGILALGAIFCDIDEPNSYFGRKFKGIAYFLNFSLGHRGFTHFLIFPILLLGLSFFFESHLIYAFILGVLLHQVGDLLTNNGIRGYFFPFFPKRSFVLLPKPLRFQTGGMFEYFTFLPVMILLFFILLYFDVRSVF